MCESRGVIGVDGKAGIIAGMIEKNYYSQQKKKKGVEGVALGNGLFS